MIWWSLTTSIDHTVTEFLIPTHREDGKDNLEYFAVDDEQREAEMVECYMLHVEVVVVVWVDDWRQKRVVATDYYNYYNGKMEVVFDYWGLNVAEVVVVVAQWIFGVEEWGDYNYEMVKRGVDDLEEHYYYGQMGEDDQFSNY